MGLAEVGRGRAKAQRKLRRKGFTDEELRELETDEPFALVINYLRKNKNLWGIGKGEEALKELQARGSQQPRKYYMLQQPREYYVLNQQVLICVLRLARNWKG